MEKRIFGELELAILSIFQKDNTARTVRDVLKALGREEDKYTTIMTVMNRLVVKGELHREKAGQSFSYSIQTTQPKSLFAQWRERIFGGRSASMISYLLETSEKMTDEEVARIEQLLAQAKIKK